MLPARANKKQTHAQRTTPTNRDRIKKEAIDPEALVKCGADITLIKGQSCVIDTPLESHQRKTEVV